MENQKPGYSLANYPKTLKDLRVTAILEGISYLVLFFITMPMKYWMDNPVPNKIFGMVHGFLFILYCILLLQAHFQGKWNWSKTILGFILSFIPFGTFYAERKMFRE
jgi:integral membrane protein